MSKASEFFKERYPLLKKGDTVIIDAESQNSCRATVVYQTESKLFTTVTSNGDDTWDIMTRRLTLLDQ